MHEAGACITVETGANLLLTPSDFHPRHPAFAPIYLNQAGLSQLLKSPPFTGSAYSTFPQCHITKWYILTEIGSVEQIQSKPVS
jgi:hypothetical protein